MLSGPRVISPGLPFSRALTTLPPPRAMERRYGSRICTGMPKRSDGLLCNGSASPSTLTFAVDPEYRTGLNRVDCFGLGNARNAAVDVAHQKRSGIAVLLPQIILGLK